MVKNIDGLAALRFERELKVGDKVRVHWTNCGSYYAAPATVARINDKSIVVTLDEAVDTLTGLGGYPVGQKIKVPRLGSAGWSANNCVNPLADHQPAAEESPEQTAGPARPAATTAAVEPDVSAVGARPGRTFYVSVEQETVLHDRGFPDAPVQDRMDQYYVVVSDVPWSAEGPDWAPSIFGPVSRDDDTTQLRNAVTDRLRQAGAKVVVCGEEKGKWHCGLYEPAPEELPETTPAERTMTAEQFLEHCGLAAGYRDKGGQRLARARRAYDLYVRAYGEPLLEKLCWLARLENPVEAVIRAAIDRDSDLPMVNVFEPPDEKAAPHNVLGIVWTREGGHDGSSFIRYTADRGGFTIERSRISGFWQRPSLFRHGKHVRGFMNISMAKAAAAKILAEEVADVIPQ
jgi:hypothetical protein